MQQFFCVTLERCEGRDGRSGGRFAFSEFECGVSGRGGRAAKESWGRRERSEEERSHPRLDGGLADILILIMKLAL